MQKHTQFTKWSIDLFVQVYLPGLNRQDIKKKHREDRKLLEAIFCEYCVCAPRLLWETSGIVQVAGSCVFTLQPPGVRPGQSSKQTEPQTIFSLPSLNARLLL